MTQTTAQRQAAYKARKQAQGLVRVSEWVHKDDAAAVRWYAKVLRDRSISSGQWKFPQAWIDHLAPEARTG